MVIWRKLQQRCCDPDYTMAALATAIKHTIKLKQVWQLQHEPCKCCTTFAHLRVVAAITFKFCRKFCRSCDQSLTGGVGGGQSGLPPDVRLKPVPSIIHCASRL